jgi:phage regulator Rha-like protein
MLSPYYEIVEKQKGEMVVSHRVIAEYTDNKAVAIQNLINKYYDDFADLGQVHFKNEPLKHGLREGMSTARTYFLNEQQASFLMTLMRNSPIVVAFKKRLVEEFYAMRNQIMRQLKYTKDGKNRIQSCGAHKGNYRKARKAVRELKAKLAESEKWLHATEVTRQMVIRERDALKLCVKLLQEKVELIP